MQKQAKFLTAMLTRVFCAVFLVSVCTFELSAQPVENCTIDDNNCNGSGLRDLSEARSKLQLFNSLIAEARKAAPNDRSRSYIAGLEERTRNELKSCQQRGDYYAQCLENVIDANIYSVQNVITEFRADSESLDVGEQSGTEAGSDGAAPESQDKNAENLPTGPSQTKSQTSKVTNAVTQQGSDEKSTLPEDTGERSGVLLTTLLVILLGIVLYFAFKPVNIPRQLRTFLRGSEGLNAVASGALTEKTEIAKLTPEQQAIYRDTLQAAHSQARWGFVFWACLIFALLYLLAARLISGPTIGQSFSAIGILAGLTGVVAYYRLAYEARKTRKAEDLAAAVRCATCGAPFAVIVSNISERLIAALPRTSTSSSSGQTNETGHMRTYVDVRTETWTEEKYEITTEYSCIICGKETREIRAETRDKNKKSGKERKYY